MIPPQEVHCKAGKWRIQFWHEEEFAAFRSPLNDSIKVCPLWTWQVSSTPCTYLLEHWMTPPYHVEIIKLIEDNTQKRNKIDNVKSRTAMRAEHMSCQTWQGILFVLALDGKTICYDCNVRWSSYLGISESFLSRTAWAGLRGHSAHGCTRHAGTQTWTQTVSVFLKNEIKLLSATRNTNIFAAQPGVLHHRLSDAVGFCFITVPLGLQA